MQLDALFLRRVRALGVVDLHDVLRVELHILTIVGELHAAADAQPHADADLAKKLRRLALGHAAADEERAFVVRHFEQHRPDAGAARLVAVELEDLALNDDVTGLWRQLADGGLLIEQIKDYDRCLAELERFLPYIDNWATCDMLAVKVVKNHLDSFIEEVCRWMESDRTYTIRFGIGMLMRYYLGDEFRIEYPRKVALVQSDEYYVNMMRAWYFATALAKQYDQILPFIEEHKLDVWTHNKSIQKALESYRITPEQKVYLKTLKI